MSKEILGTHNHKTQCACFNLPPIISCPGNTELCRKTCYAKSTNNYNPASLRQQTRNLKLTKQSDFVKIIVEVIRDYTSKNFRKDKEWRSKYFRIHESGDFYSQEYLNSWIQVCNKLPNINFLAFTKTKFDFRNKPENLAVIYSIFPDSKFVNITCNNFAFAGSSQIYNLSVNDYIDCPGQCNLCAYCWHPGNKKVLFKFHGSLVTKELRNL